MIAIISALMTAFGLIIVIGTIKERYDKRNEEEYDKTQFFIDLLKGTLAVIIGIVGVFDIISESRVINLLILLTGLNIFIDFKFKYRSRL